MDNVMTACKIDYFRRVASTSDAHNKDRWRHDSVGMLRVDCEGGAGAPVGSRVDVWSLGQLDIVDGCLAHMSLAPLAGRGDTWLDLKLIRSGAMYIEQGGRTQRIGPGEIVLIASSHVYRQSFDEQTEITALRFPSHALKERGLWHDLRGPITPDMSAADTRAIGELVMSIAAQRGKTSEGLRRRQGDQLLELIDLLIDDPAVMMRTRRSDATLFRARRFIAQNLRNGELTVSRIAAAQASQSCASFGKAALNWRRRC
jgi:hypothetical protein